MIEWSPAVTEIVTAVMSQIPDLTQSELKMLCAAVEGQVAYCGPSPESNHPHNNPLFADFWAPDRDVRAQLVRWLCVHAAEAVDPRGIFIHGARIEGDLDLSFTTIPFPLIFQQCRILRPLHLWALRSSY